MKPDEVKKPNGKAFRTEQVREIERCHLADGYAIETFSYNPIGSTGLLVVARLNPADRAKPSFLCRWHEKESAVDIESENVSPAEKRNFKEGRNNCFGHHTTQVSSTSRTVKLSIVWRGQKVYEGLLEVPVHREIEVSAHMGVLSQYT